jgi:Tol biopolymer transport system component
MVSLEDHREQDFVIHVKSGPCRTRWSPDGKWILLTGDAGEQGAGLYMADVQKGKASLLVADQPTNWIRQYDWSSDGRSVYYLRNKGGKIVDCNLDTGAERIIYSSAADFAISADRKWIATMDTDVHKGTITMNVLPSSGGPRRQILRLQMPEWISAFCWTPDGNILMMKGRRDRIDDPHQLWKISTQDGKLQNLGLSTDYAYDLRIHPDGKRIAIWTVIDTSELWVLNNFL